MYRAHAMLEQVLDRPLPVACQLDKRIPAGAGLGGGSSDAAGMLVGLRELFELPIDDAELLAIAPRLGADVVFAVHGLLGRGAALVTGVGEIIEPLDRLPGFDAVLIFPDGCCPTAEVYRMFDRVLCDAQKQIPEALVRAWAVADQLPTPHNDLTNAATEVCPSISIAMQNAQAWSLELRMTGSGSALFGLTQTQAEAITIAKALCKAGLNACETSFFGLKKPC